MRKIAFLLLIVVPVFFALFVVAQEEKEEKIPPGMEIMYIGKTKFVVPKGAQFRKEGNWIILENAAEYTARRLLDMEERLAKTEARIKELNEKIEQLERTLVEIQQDKAVPAVQEKQLETTAP